MVDITARLVPELNENFLGAKQRVDYENHRRNFVEWLAVFGKDPERVQGYARETVDRTARRCGKFDRWVWQEEGGYTLPTQGHANEYLKGLAYEDYSGTHKTNTRAALLRYFNWRHHEYGEDAWEPEITFSADNDIQPRDFLSLDERKLIRQAALEYGSIPSYANLTPEERARWKRHVAQSLGKPLEEITLADWDRLNGWKYTTMIWTSLDAGLRPIEVERAKTSWVDVDNQILRIPAEDSAKNTENWRVSITDRTADALERWLDERQNYERYTESDALWLTRSGNPYNSQSLRRLIRRLCEQAGIETQNRKMSWYSIRHSVGTYMTREEDLAAAKAQLRHKSIQTTAKYDQAPVEDRRDALERMG